MTLACPRFAAAIATLCCGLAAVATAFAADDVRQYRPTDRVDPAEVRRILGGEPPAPRIRMRSIRVLDGSPEPAPEAAAGPSALALPVQFAFDSATILPQARGQLDALAEGIKQLPPERRVLIEGHTDAAGPDQYNMQLSDRRAIAVKNYLVAVHGIDAGRLATRGYGESRPINAENPYAGENRRVQFRGE